MQYLVSRPWIFRTQQRRRIRRMIVALALFTAFNLSYAGFSAADAGALQQKDDTFGRLTEPSNLMASPAGQEGTRVYKLTGNNVRFQFTRNQRNATIKILCTGGVTPCGEAVELKAERGTGGDLVFKTQSGKRVLKITSAGGGTLFGGAPFIPREVPKTGAAFVQS